MKEVDSKLNFKIECNSLFPADQLASYKVHFILIPSLFSYARFRDSIRTWKQEWMWIFQCFLVKNMTEAFLPGTF